DIAREYEQAGAAAISVLTERDYFLGSGQYLQEIARAVATSVLRKDFIIDEYQIYEARVLGASAVLLICAVLDDARLTKFLQLAHDLGLSALVEAHDEDEVRRALAAGAQIIGVNNRNLKDFTVSLDTSCRLRPLVPPSVLFVAESGIKTAADTARLREHGVDAVLIGETFMRSADKKAMLDELAGKHHG
ncbi:indole-3-glycerol phosphate synthase TrpC, partial [uncultured Megasphaera sp.]|uniref:indole-3-glycerol phosphate synthase TrpC n=1 Tax=uncultured Megasphaera sp. TaxID=165188 RepID=UPI0026593416